MSHSDRVVPYAGWYSEDKKPVFAIKIEAVTDGAVAVWFGRVPAWSSDSWSYAHVKAMATDRLVGKTAVVYVIAYGGVTQEQSIALIVEALDKYRLSGGEES